jgi:hypothetical protein
VPPTPTAKRLAKNVYFENLPTGRRVLVNTVVCLREGSYGLECFLCKRGTKEHESILAADADARVIHFALEAAGAKAGSPVQFDPKFKPPTGPPIKVTVQYKDEKGKAVTLPAQQWIRDVKTKKCLEQDWVFAGSQLVPDTFEPKNPPIYLAAGDGAMICVSNVPSAMLDLPIESPKSLENREFAPFTERIPPLRTPVVVILEPLRKEKK